jgi:hypothetical protein
MATTSSTRRKIPTALIAVTVVFVAALIAGIVYLSRPVPQREPPGPSPEAKAYLPNLALSDVTMKATENFMKQQVVEVEGKITNNGPRQIKRIDVYCIFRAPNGEEVYRERVPVVQATPTAAFAPGQTRSFRLPFDTLPDNWNQALPNLVIAQIVFAK